MYIPRVLFLNERATSFPGPLTWLGPGKEVDKRDVLNKWQQDSSRGEVADLGEGPGVWAAPPPPPPPPPPLSSKSGSATEVFACNFAGGVNPFGEDIFAGTALFTIIFSHLQCHPAWMRGNFGLKLQNSPKLPHIRVRFYCNANDQS